MQNNYLNFLSKKSKKIILINLLSVLIFAILYYIQDYIISYYPIFSKKYLLESKNKNNNDKDNDITLKPFIYYIWFSLITQSTVGYTGIIRNDNRPQSFNNIISIPFKVLNILQISSIFIIPGLVL